MRVGARSELFNSEKLPGGIAHAGGGAGNSLIVSQKVSPSAGAAAISGAAVYLVKRM